jgi:hypothetical protein
MSLDLSRVEKLVELGDGMKRGRCPACAEAGGDRKGQHLRIYPDGKFGCCVHPQDSEHRGRIFALAGERKPKGITIRVASVAAVQPVRRGILKAMVAEQPETPDAPDGVGELETTNAEENESRTGRTGERQSNSTSMETENLQRTGRTGQQDWTEELFTSERTLRTPQYSLRGTTVDNEGIEKEVYILKGFDEGVRCVRQQTCSDSGRLPYLTPSGDLVIPFDSPGRYHWWTGGQSPRRTMQELLGRKENYASPF